MTYVQQGDVIGLQYKGARAATVAFDGSMCNEGGSVHSYESVDVVKGTRHTFTVLERVNINCRTYSLQAVVQYSECK